MHQQKTAANNKQLTIVAKKQRYKISLLTGQYTLHQINRQSQRQESFIQP
jgi:hypothetical protein